MQRKYLGLLVVALAAFAAGSLGNRLNGAAAAGSVQANRAAAENPAPSAASVPRRIHPSIAPVSSRSFVTAAPLPPSGTPLKQSRADLLARAKAGDVAAASRLYKDTHRCAEVRRINARVPRMVKRMLAENPGDVSAAVMQTQDSFLKQFRDQLDFAEENADFCAGLSNDEINDLVPEILLAAQLGDVNAAVCYLGSGIGVDTPGLLDHPEWLTQFKEHALALAESAVRSGNWTAAGLLQFAYSGDFPSGILAQLTGTDRVQSYRYAKLLRLGMPAGAKLVYLDKQLAANAEDLSPAQRLQGDAWAQDTYQRYFSANPTGASTNLNICQYDDAANP